MIKLLRLLVRLSVGQSDSGWIEEGRDILRGTRPVQWEAVWKTLALHRIESLIAHALDSHDLSDSVTTETRCKLEHAYRETLLTNTVLMRTATQVIEVMRQRGVEPVIWKGLLLADSFYPDLGVRWFGDIDFAIELDEKDIAREALASVGFRPFAIQSDAICYKNKMGVVLDVHHRVRLFEDRQSLNMTTLIEPRHIALPTIRVLEPAAMMSLLVDHLVGHRRNEGFVLRWLIDFVFVMRYWGDSIDIEKLNYLMPSCQHWLVLLRTLRLLQFEFHATIPDVFAALASEAEPLTLSEVLRHRRLSQWKVRTLRGWFRLAACRFGVWPRGGRDFPQPMDLLMWPRDALRERRELRRWSRRCTSAVHIRSLRKRP